MKKLLIGAVVLLLVVCGAVYCIDYSLPNADTLEFASAPTEDGTRYVLDNTLFKSRIFTLDENGHASAIYQELRRASGQASAISHVAFEQNMYFIRQYYAQNEETPLRWELCMLDEKDEAVSLGGSELTWLQVTDLTTDYGTVRVAGLDSDGVAVLCSWKNGVWTLEQTVDCGALNAWVGTDGLIVLLPDGRSVEYIGMVQRELESAPAQQMPEITSVSAGVRFACKQTLLIMALSFIAFLFIICLLAYRLRFSRTVVVRMTFMVAESLFVLFVIVGMLFCTLGTISQMNETEEFAEFKAKAISSLLQTSSANELLALTEYREIDDPVIDRVLGHKNDIIFALRDGELTVAAAKSYPFGAAAEEILDKETLALAYQVIDGGLDGSVRAIGGRMHTVCAVPVKSNGIVTGVYVNTILSEQIIDSFVSFAVPVVRLLIVMYLITVLAGFILMRRIFRPVSELTKQMNRISDGDLKAQKKSGRNDELGLMHETMQRMCTNLSIREYEIEEIIRAYRRFVPTSLHRLLDRGDFMEVRFGDAKTITGSLCLFAVGNRTAAQTALNDAQYVQFVNSAFSPLYEQTQKYQGELLSSDFNLSMVPVFFPYDPVDAVRACLGVMGEIQQKDERWKPELNVILHHTDFLYGIAGSAERVFPFVASDEIRLLNSCSDQLHSIGVPVAATESYLKKAGRAGNLRYIGFISSPDGKYSNKLYEILDAYSDIERSSRMQNDKLFQEAIKNYYKGDFYLARNQFLALVRACPEDGVACWYLMACEKVYNMEPEQVDYQLFGVEF